MIRKVVFICGFVLIFLLAAWGLFYMQKKSEGQPVRQVKEAVVEKKEVKTDAWHAYQAQSVKAECLADDNIFCAVERTVKCTLVPEMEGCDKGLIPSFILGKAAEEDRPTEISFKITKIKPIAESSDISVYTDSDCNAMWFGLCKGTVVYSLSPRSDNTWAVTNILALE